jgi:predicted nucleotidyltransferase component of viral defense system
MIDLIKQRLDSLRLETALGSGLQERENATKQILQEIALYALWQSNFFEVALFQGGTSLRILHGLPRYSEDLDFMLRRADEGFKWDKYLRPLVQIFKQFGLALTAVPRGQMDSRIRTAILKDDSIANQLDLEFTDQGRCKAIKIKLEIDVKPPPLSGEATTFLDFPLDHEVRHQDLPSNFALKIHALLCRGFLKGRDWYDFAWYVAKDVSPNLPHLQAALLQSGLWAGTNGLLVDNHWLEVNLGAAINAIVWKDAADDVRRFLRTHEAKSLDLWSERFFSAKLAKLVDATIPK